MMNYHQETRIMSVSFERDPQEHATVMLAAGRRFAATRAAGFTWPVLLSAIGYGIVLGLAMELYRRFVLSIFFPLEAIPPLNIVLTQMLPFLLLLYLLYLGRAYYLARARRRALIERLGTDVFIDTDIYRDGVTATSGESAVSLNWTGVRSLAVINDRIELDGDAFVLYIPRRAFANKPAFDAAAGRISELLWKARVRAGENKPAASIGKDAREP
jgi:hypothetical protein